MTSIDHDTMPLMGTATRSLRFRALQKVSDLIAALSKRRERKRAIEQLSALDDHLLRDIGLNPQDLRDAFEGRRTSLLFSPLRMPFNPD